MRFTKGPDREAALEKYRRLAPTYDRQVALFGPLQEGLRREAVARLELAAGQTVVDVGCGGGLSFPLLAEAVGAEGSVIGADQSPDMLAVARARIDQYGWQNVTLVEAPAADVALPVRPDAALFFFTHDIMRSPDTLENVLGQVRSGGRVVSAGARRPPWWASPLSLPVFLVARRYVTTLEGAARPWSHLERLVPALSVGRRLAGTTYIAWSNLP